MKIIAVFFFTLALNVSYSQTTLEGTIYVIMPVGSDLNYALIKVNDQQVYYKSSVYNSSELRNKQQVELLLKDETGIDAEVLGGVTNIRIFAKN